MPLGISVLPRMATPSDDHPFLITRPISDPEISRIIGVIRRRGGACRGPRKVSQMLMGVWGKN